MANVDTLKVNGNIGNNFIKLAMDKIYPIGSLFYTSVEHGDPGALYGAGAWELVMNDQISVGAGSNGTTNYTGGSTGGAVNQQHYHNETFGFYGSNGGTRFGILSYGGTNSYSNSSTPTDGTCGAASRVLQFSGYGVLGPATNPRLHQGDSTAAIGLMATSADDANVVQPSYRVFIYKRTA